MFHTFGPAEVADVNQSIDTVLDLDESSKVGQVAYPAFDGHADRILIMQGVPRIFCKLPHAQGNAALARIDVQHHTFDLIADVNQLRRMLHALGPRHFTDVHQTFDALLEFHEGTIVGHADHAARNMRSHGIAVLGV